MTSRPSVLVAGFSARALARSALWAGFDVVAVDGFGDRDLLETPARPIAHVLVQPFRPGIAARRSRAFRADAVVYGSNFENHPTAVAALAKGRVLWGNAPDVLGAVRDPARVAATLRAAGLPAPRLGMGRADRSGTSWLVKPRRGGGGRGIRAWVPGEPVQRSEYLQEFVAGSPGSIVFLADGRYATPLALTRQLAGDARFGADGHCYVGSLLASRQFPLFEAQDAVYDSALRVARVLTSAFELRGLNTVDFVARGGVAWPVEVNPRHSASVELIERELDRSLFRSHVESSLGAAPHVSHDPLGWCAVPGKAILYARRPFVMAASDELLAAGDVADVSADGTPVPAGAPVCTVFARGGSFESCVAALARRGATILPQLVLEGEAA